MTTAEKISSIYENGMIWDVEIDGKAINITDMCKDEGAIVICDDVDSGLIRFLFSDGSAIVTGDGGWDIEGNEPFSWCSSY